MKRRFYLVLMMLAAVMAVSLMGCGSDSGRAIDRSAHLKDEEDEDEDEDEAEAEVETEEAEAYEAPAADSAAYAEAAEPAEEPAEEAAPAYTACDMVFSGWGYRYIPAFHHGRAFVEFQMRDPEYLKTSPMEYYRCLGFIDEEGRVLYSIDERETVPSSEVIFTDPQSGENGDGIYYFGYRDLILILNKDGEELFRSNPGVDENGVRLFFLGAAEGRFVIGKQVSNFSENKYILYVMNEKGEALTKETEMDFTGFPPFSYKGEGIMCASSYYYNIGNGEFIDTLKTDYSGTDIYNFGECDGILDSYCYSGFGNAALSRNAFEDQETFDSYIQGKKYIITEDALPEGYREIKGDTFGEGLLFASGEAGYGYVDINGALQVKLDLPEGVSVSEAGAFMDGYALIRMNGVNGKGYMGIVDKSGELQYEPIERSYGINDLKTWKGYILLDESGYNSYYDPALVTPGGEVLTLDDSWDELGEDAYLSTNGHVISGGYIFVRDNNRMKYYSLDKGKVVDHVQVSE